MSGGRGQGGFSLIELMISVLLVGIVSLALGSAFVGIKQGFDSRDIETELVQGARVALDLMAREIRMAGYDPTGTAGAGIASADASTIRITADYNGDGDVTDADEDLTYSLYTTSGVQRLGRKSGAGNNEAVADYVESLSFAYYDGSNNLLATPVGTPANIRRVVITVTMRSAKVDQTYSQNNGIRTFTLSTQVRPRNL